MARDYDTQLLESVAVRRRRLRDAVAFGRERTRRTLDENVNKIIAGLCVAAVVCAGCVGWSFVRTRLPKQQAAQSQPADPTTANPDVPVPAGWVGTQVTFAMLHDALDQAHVSSKLYVLPGQPRPAAARVYSYYLLAKTQDGFTAGLVEGRQGRVGAQFSTEDEACRSMYAELVVKETAPVRLAPPQEQQAARQSGSLAQDVRNKLARSAGDPLTYTLNPGAPVDTFGQESVSALSPDGTPFAQRGLPQSAHLTVDPRVPRSYERYRVLKSFAVNASMAEPGGGIRFTLNAGLFPNPPTLLTVRWLLRSGYLGRVAVGTVPA